MIKDSWSRMRFWGATFRVISSHWECFEEHILGPKETSWWPFNGPILPMVESQGSLTCRHRRYNLHKMPWEGTRDSLAAKFSSTGAVDFSYVVCIFHHGIMPLEDTWTLASCCILAYRNHMVSDFISRHVFIPAHSYCQADLERPPSGFLRTGLAKIYMLCQWIKKMALLTVYISLNKTKFSSLHKRLVK